MSLLPPLFVMFEFVHKVHIFVRVYLDAGGRDVFVAQNAAQYFSDYPLVPRYSFYPGHYFIRNLGK